MAERWGIFLNSKAGMSFDEGVGLDALAESVAFTYPATIIGRNIASANVITHVIADRTRIPSSNRLLRQLVL